MNFKFLCLLLSVVLTIEAFHAAPLTDGSGDLKLFVLDNLVRISKLEVENYKKLAEKVIVDPAVLELKTELMDTYLNDYRKYIAQVNSLDNGDWVSSPKSVEIMNEISRLNELFTAPETDEGKLIKAALIRHGIFEQGEEFQTVLRTFGKEFTERAQHFLDSLNVGEKQSEKKLSEILNNIKNEPNELQHYKLIIGYLQ